MVGKIMALNVEKIYASEEQVSKLSAMQNAMKPLERYASLYARTEILCAYTISRFGTNVPHALMDHIESMYLKKKKIMTFLLLIQVSPTQYCSFINSHLYQKSLSGP